MSVLALHASVTVDPVTIDASLLGAPGGAVHDAVLVVTGTASFEDGPVPALPVPRTRT